MNCEQMLNGSATRSTARSSPSEQAQLDAHCRDCERCRELLNDLMEIRAAAATLDRRTPSPEVWNAIAAKSTPPPRRGYAACRRGCRWRPPPRSC